MLYVIKIIYATFLLPPGIFLLPLLWMLYQIRARKQRYFYTLAIFTLAFYLSSIPIVSDTLVRSLENRYTPSASIDGDVIVMLGGGATVDTPNINGTGHLSGYAANRLLTTAQLHHQYKLPVIVSGGKVLSSSGPEAEIAKRTLINLGVPENDIFIENQSLNTTQNAYFTKRILDDKGFTTPILVTSAFHMHRSVLQFEKTGVNVLPYPTDYQTNVKQYTSVFDFVPSASAMNTIAMAVKEYVALAAVKWY